MVYWVSAVCGVNWWYSHKETEMNGLTLCSVMIVVLWMTEGDGWWRWKCVGGYEPRWEFMVTTSHIESRSPRVGVSTCRIGMHTCHITDGKFTHRWNFVISQCLAMTSRICSRLCLSRSELCHHMMHNVKSSPSISQCHDYELTSSSAYNK